MSFLAFEHQLIEHFKKINAEKFTVACSGGLDSAVLVTGLAKIKPLLKADIQVLHVHHGFSEKKDEIAQSKYRDRALKFVESLAQTHSLDFFSERSESFLKSEEDCRDFRISVFKNFENVLTAHHKDDLLETVLMRMLRGAGPQGLESPFHEQSLKPFLYLFNKAKIKDYADSKDLDWIDDPSNLNTDPLRNWVRESWLKDLDEKIGKEGLEQSLLLISEAMKGKARSDLDTKVSFQSSSEGFFSLNEWLSLDRFQKQSMIAHILLKTRKKGYTKGQIEEVVKQLDQSKKSTTFRSGKVIWDKSESKVSFRLDL